MPIDSPLPLVSIVVPAYNAERYLRESLDSIVSQTYPALEILVMDDASRDGTEAIARSYGGKLAYRRQAANRGQFGNVQDGLALAVGKYIAVFHADDIYDPEMIARQVEFLEGHPEVGAVFAMEIFIGPDGQETGRLKLPREYRAGVPHGYRTVLNALLRYKNCIFPGPGSMVRTEVYTSIGPYRGKEFPVAGDFEMFLRIAREHPVAILDAHLFRYRWGHGNADQMDRRLRTAEEPFFAIMDEHLREGGRALAEADALRAYEARRAEDSVMRAMNCYLLDRREEMRRILQGTSFSRLLASGKVQRWRLGLLLAALSLMARGRRLDWVAEVFRKRWYGREATSGAARAESPPPSPGRA